MPPTTAASTVLAISLLTMPAGRPWKARASRGMWLRSWSVTAGCPSRLLRWHGWHRPGAPQPEPVDGPPDRLVGGDALHPHAAHRLGRHRPGGLPDDLGQVHLGDHVLGQADQVDPADHGVDVDPGRDRVDVDRGHDAVQVDPLPDDAVQVQPTDDGVEVHPLHRLVEVDGGDQVVEVHVAAYDVGQIHPAQQRVGDDRHQQVEQGSHLDDQPLAASGTAMSGQDHPGARLVALGDHRWSQHEPGQRSGDRPDRSRHPPPDTGREAHRRQRQPDGQVDRGEAVRTRDRLQLGRRTHPRLLTHVRPPSGWTGSAGSASPGTDENQGAAVKCTPSGVSSRVARPWATSSSRCALVSIAAMPWLNSSSSSYARSWRVPPGWWATVKPVAGPSASAARLRSRRRSWKASSSSTRWCDDGATGPCAGRIVRSGSERTLVSDAMKSPSGSGVGGTVKPIDGVIVGSTWSPAKSSPAAWSAYT